MNFHFEHYLQLLNDNKNEEAFNYRISNMPKTLYKYTSLSHDKDESNIKKFKTLNNNKIWLSTYNNLNDPYELKALFLNKKSLAEKGWSVATFEEVMTQVRKSFLISSFTSSVTDNMPMWAHYASNHKGFCIKYNVNDAKFIYKVVYKLERIPIDGMITSFYNSYNNKNKDLKDKNLKHFRIISHLPIIKHKSWIYENEYRLVFYNIFKDNKGREIDIKKLGLSIDSIYIGSECSNKNKEKLLSIGNNLNIDVYEMYLDDSNINYSLQCKLLKH